MGEGCRIDESISGTDHRAPKPSMYLWGLHISQMSHMPQPGAEDYSTNGVGQLGPLWETFFIGALPHTTPKNKSQMDQKQNFKIS